MELAFSHIAALYSLQKLAASNSKFFSLQSLQIDYLIKKMEPSNGRNHVCPMHSRPAGLRRLKSDLVTTPADRIRDPPSMPRRRIYFDQPSCIFCSAGSEQPNATSLGSSMAEGRLNRMSHGILIFKTQEGAADWPCPVQISAAEKGWPWPARNCELRQYLLVCHARTSCAANTPPADASMAEIDHIFDKGGQIHDGVVAPH